MKILYSLKRSFTYLSKFANLFVTAYRSPVAVVTACVSVALASIWPPIMQSGVCWKSKVKQGKLQLEKRTAVIRWSECYCSVYQA